MTNNAFEFHHLTLACPKTLLLSSCSRKLKLLCAKFKLAVRKNPYTTVKEAHLSVKIAGYITTMGTAVAQWLRCCATNRKVAGSIPAGVIGIFH